MRILVTGGCGFVGSHLVQYLLGADHEIRVLEHPSCDRSRIPDTVPVDLHDFGLDPQAATPVVQDFRPEVVVHLAGIVRAAPEREWIEPLVRSNVLFGTRLLQDSLDTGVSRFVAAGSYWQSPFRPGEYHPVNLYAATKEAFADIARYYGTRNQIAVTVLKMFGNYGPQDHRTNLFSALRDAAIAEKPVAMSDGTQEIDLIHIDDVCRAVDAAGTGSAEPGYREYEVGTGTTASVREIAAWFAAGAGRDLNIQWGARPQPTHHERAAAIEPIRQELGWEPTIMMREGITALGEAHRDG